MSNKYLKRLIHFSEVSPTESVSKTKRTIKHGARFSRKVQNRLTQRTLAEARALKEQGTECIHVLLYVAELVRLDIQFINLLFLSIRVIIIQNFVIYIFKYYYFFYNRYNDILLRGKKIINF